MVEDGATLVGNTPEDFAKFIKAEQARWGAVITKAKITMD